jgi:DNA topoisomerase-1
MATAAKTLVIVESPAKCPKLKQILGPGYEVVASCGHMLDVPHSLAWIKDGLTADQIPYNAIASKKPHIAKIRKAAQGATDVLIASDMDREGEAIGFHICSVLNLDPAKTKRILFDQITAEAVLKAVSEPVAMRTDMYRAQQARRVIDLLFGYSISPHLWHIAPKLSAGRCQSPALAWMHERQREFLSHDTSSTYFDVAAKLRPELPAKLRCEKQQGEDAAAAQLQRLKTLYVWRIVSDRAASTTQNAPPAFTTSAMQQKCSSKWKWTPKKTMEVAQKLYESGHITYMRTDCTRLSDTFVQQASAAVKSMFGEGYLAAAANAAATQQQQPKPKKSSKKEGHAQEAHEPVRPVKATVTSLTESACGHADGPRLYRLIYCQAMSSVMSPCVSHVHSFELHSDSDGEADRPAHEKQVLLAKWTGVQFAGFRIWEFEGATGDAAPPLKCPFATGDAFDACQYVANEKCAPRPRPYSPGDMVKLLEEKGVGRPSTYSSILERLSDRGYVDTSKKAWTDAIGKLEVRSMKHLTIDMLATPAPTLTCTTTPSINSNELQSRYFVTPLGEQVCSHMQANFESLLGQELTAKLEADLDEIVHGNCSFEAAVGAFRQTLGGLVPATAAPSERRRLLGEQSDGAFYAMQTKNGEAVAFIPIDRKTKAAFAAVPSGCTKDTVTLEQAREAIADRSAGGGGRPVATTPAGDTVYAKEGKYGKYLSCTVSSTGETKTCTFKDDVDVGELAAETALAWLSEKKQSGVVRQLNDTWSVRCKDGSYYIMKKQGGKVEFASLDASTEQIEKLRISDCKQVMDAKKETKARGRTSKKPMKGRGKSGA